MKNQKRENRSINPLSIVSLIISIFAFLASVSSLITSIYYNQKEYEYKRKPEIEVKGAPQIELDSSGENPQLTLSGINIEILKKNNLEGIYIIQKNNEVTRLDLKDIENNVKNQMEYKMHLKPDITKGQYKYWYFFLYFKTLDGTDSLQLIYTKTWLQYLTLNGVSEVEIYGFENSYPDDPAYEGEKIMAKQYEKIVNEISKYKLLVS